MTTLLARNCLYRIINNSRVIAPKSKFIFLVLQANSSCSMIHLSKSFSRLCNLKVFPSIGHAQAFYNEPSVLVKAILQVKASYFSSGYISKEQWKMLWQQSLRSKGELIEVKILDSEDLILDAINSLKKSPFRIHLSGIFKQCPRTPALKELALRL